MIKFNVMYFKLIFSIFCIFSAFAYDNDKDRAIAIGYEARLNAQTMEYNGCPEWIKTGKFSESIRKNIPNFLKDAFQKRGIFERTTENGIIEFEVKPSSSYDYKPENLNALLFVNYLYDQLYGSSRSISEIANKVFKVQAYSKYDKSTTISDIEKYVKQLRLDDYIDEMKRIITLRKRSDEIAPDVTRDSNQIKFKADIGGIMTPLTLYNDGSIKDNAENTLERQDDGTYKYKTKVASPVFNTGNEGGTHCWFDSAVQVLASSPKFCEIIRKMEMLEKEKKLDVKDCFAGKLNEIFEALRTGYIGQSEMDKYMEQIAEKCKAKYGKATIETNFTKFYFDNGGKKHYLYGYDEQDKNDGATVTFENYILMSPQSSRTFNHLVLIPLMEEYASLFNKQVYKDGLNRKYEILEDVCWWPDGNLYDKDETELSTNIENGKVRQPGLLLVIAPRRQTQIPIGDKRYNLKGVAESTTYHAIAKVQAPDGLWYTADDLKKNNHLELIGEKFQEKDFQNELDLAVYELED